MCVVDFPNDMREKKIEKLILKRGTKQSKCQQQLQLHPVQVMQSFNGIRRKMVEGSNYSRANPITN